MPNRITHTTLLLSLTVFLAFHARARAQVIRAEEAVNQVPTAYPVFTGRVDTIFIFCSPDDTGTPVTGSLTAVPEHGSPGWDFEWSRLDTLSFAWVPFHTETGQPSSTLSGLGSGGYRIRITDGGGTSRYYYTWVYVRKLEVTAGIRNLTCQYLALEGSIDADSFRYFDPDDHSGISLPNPVSFLWSADPPTIIPGQSTDLLPVTWTPPTVDTDFFLTATDALGCSQEATFFFESIFPKADFSVDYALDAQNRKSSPLDVFFTNNSENSVSYKWIYGDGSDTLSLDPLQPVKHTYYNDPEVDPGLTSRYEITLITTSEELCQDSMKVIIEVDPSTIEVMNVFTPNDDTHNDYFMLDHVSLRVLQVQIFNRYGEKIYEFFGESNAIRDWKGWDGKIRGTNRLASPGIYPYVIKGFGWDGETYELKGMVYLFR